METERKNFQPMNWLVVSFNDVYEFFGCESCEVFWCSDKKCFVCGNPGLTFSRPSPPLAKSLIRA